MFLSKLVIEIPTLAVVVGDLLSPGLQLRDAFNVNEQFAPKISSDLGDRVDFFCSLRDDDLSATAETKCQRHAAPRALRESVMPVRHRDPLG